MEITTIEMRKITPAEGMALTNGVACSEIGGAVYLGKNDDAANWREITGEEYEEFMRALSEEAKI